MNGDYQIIQAITEILSLILKGWQLLFGILLGGSGIYFFNKIKVKKRNLAKIDQTGSSDSQAQQTVDSPNSPSQQSGTDAHQYNAQGDVNVYHDSGFQEVGTISQALGSPDVGDLNSGQSFICTQIEKLIRNSGEIYDPREDYNEAVSLLNTDPQNAATLLFRVYGRISTYFQTAQFFRSAQAELVKFEESLRTIESIHSGQDVDSDLGSVLSEIERATRDLFSVLRI